MKDNYRGIKVSLSKVEFEYIDTKYMGIIDIDAIDSVDVIEIGDNDIALKISRDLKFKPINVATIKVECMVSLRINSLISKEQFIKDIKKGMGILNAAFSKISLTISEITNNSSLGALITPPTYDINNIKIY
ncbi:MAG: hypothetical protein IJ458_03790 [Clostridia bacterium]|nr:hypothetical protein [Clostridia bacterium]